MRVICFTTLVLLVVSVLLFGCSPSKNTIVTPNPTDGRISDSYAPIDTVHCEFGREILRFRCEGVPVRGDFLLAELRHIVETVQTALVSGEELDLVTIGSIPRCIRLSYPGYDLSASTCTERDSTGACLGGRYFSFVRTEGALKLWEVGELSLP